MFIRWAAAKFHQDPSALVGCPGSCQRCVYGQYAQTNKLPPATNSPPLLWSYCLIWFDRPRFSFWTLFQFVPPNLPFPAFACVTGSAHNPSDLLKNEDKLSHFLSDLRSSGIRPRRKWPPGSWGCRSRLHSRSIRREWRAAGAARWAEIHLLDPNSAAQMLIWTNRWHRNGVQTCRSESAAPFSVEAPVVSVAVVPGVVMVLEAVSKGDGPLVKSQSLSSSFNTL